MIKKLELSVYCDIRTNCNTNEVDKTKIYKNYNPINLY